MPPHRVLEHPVFLQRVHLFAANGHMHPIIFHATNNSWAAAQEDYETASLCWKNFRQQVLSTNHASSSKANEKKLKNMMIWCCRNAVEEPGHFWIFRNLIDSDLELDKKYNNYLLPLDVLFQKAKLVIHPEAKIGVQEDDEVEAKTEEEKLEEEKKRKQIFNECIRLARIILETKDYKVKGLTLQLAIKTEIVENLPDLSLIEALLQKVDGDNVPRRPQESLDLYLVSQLKTEKKYEIAELYLRYNADPLQRMKFAGFFKAEPNVVRIAKDSGDVKFVELLFRKAHPEYKLLSKEPRKGLNLEVGDPTTKADPRVIDYVRPYFAGFKESQALLDLMNRLESEL